MKDRRGFMLTELLVTLALLAMLAPYLLGLMEMGSGLLTFAQKQTVAVCLAQECVETMKGSDYCELHSVGQEIVEGFHGFSREVDITEKSGDSALPIKEATVTVCWQQGTTAHTVSQVVWVSWR